MAVVDITEITQKYAAEAQKRVRPDGLAQYTTLSNSDSERLRHLVDDIWADHAALDAAPSPLGPDTQPKFLIAGAGIGGIISAVRLIQQGFRASQIRLVETAGGVGGTWYWNRYPGLHCDVEAYIYMPLLEEMGYMPSHRYAPGAEIRRYLNQVVEKYDLTDKILFRTQLKQIEWDDEARVWKCDITTGRGPKGQHWTPSTVTAEFVYLTAGLLAKPHIPKLGGVGVEGFQGDMFHTSLWNYDVTGGSSEDVFSDMSKLKDKRVGVIGTGATAVQVVPCLAKYAKEVYVFQRTPSACYTRGQHPTDPEAWKTRIATKPGWHAHRMRNFAAHISHAGSPGENLVNDEWSNQPAYSALTGDPQFARIAPDQVPAMLAHFHAADAAHSARLRARVAEVVEDPATAAKLTPWYPAWCKRPTFSDTYLQAFNAPHVHLVDTDGRGVSGITPSGVQANDTEFPVDVLVLSTGYASPIIDGGDPSIRADVTVLGRGGRSLTQKFADRGVATLHGLATHGFPNLFWLGPAQAGVNANHQHVLDVLASHAAGIVGAAHRRTAATSRSNALPTSRRGVVVEVAEPAEEAWADRLAGSAARFAALLVCTPSYVTGEAGPGAPPPPASPELAAKNARRVTWPAGLETFIQELEAWREVDGGLSGINVTTAAAA
ncbi:FAD/NAD(P)-binding domain-containing protein [Xylariomycetidae sp. FL0641]|nr:FAD/NAD(P)-binding domain-containing protein [Xylariomycetidae sp. FL0641]